MHPTRLARRRGPHKKSPMLSIAPDFSVWGAQIFNQIPVFESIGYCRTGTGENPFQSARSDRDGRAG
ncbi:hypothetical protein ACAF76_012145 [Brevibacillus sp. TJ4]|uniref:hypothetical protein n=1 Tax=Brevibacillus sp. TJ4 TaxID=3234853 RepID=UPI003B9F0AF3